MKKLATLVAVLAGITLSGTAFAASGSYASDAYSPPIYAPNSWYITNFPIVGFVPSTAKLHSRVSYYYTVGTIPRGGRFVAELCQGNFCVNVTSARRGVTAAFNGRSATVPLHLRYRINRSSSFSPVAGGRAQVLVNWTTN
ncbi:MAG: flagellar protein FlhE [Azoarcus sp.]|nr:flagellar protein FlhE [Azoarcus sp.]